MWYDYATFMMRTGGPPSLPASEEALREALALDSTHQPAMAALAGLLLQQGQATDPIFLEGGFSVAGPKLPQVSCSDPTLPSHQSELCSTQRQLLHRRSESDSGTCPKSDFTVPTGTICDSSRMVSQNLTV